MKKNLLKVFMSVFITFMSLLAKAQPVDPPEELDPLPSPIDGQIIFLVALGIAFAYYMINKKKISLKNKKYNTTYLILIFISL